MGKINGWFSKKYLQRIWLTVTLVIVLLVLISSVTLYMSSERTVLRVHERANDKVLQQIDYNIRYMNEIATSTASFLFFDTEVTLLRLAKELDDYLYIKSINKLDAVTSSSSFIHSMFIYNRYHDDFFIANGASRYSLDQRFLSKLKEYIHSGAISSMQFIPYSFESSEPGNRGSFDMFLFAMYEPDAKGKIENMLILAISPEWIFENIHMLNQPDTAYQGSFLIMDGNRELLFRKKQAGLIDSDELSVITGMIERTSQDRGSFTIGAGKHRKAVTYLDTGVNDWVVLNVQPYDSVMSDVLDLRNTSIWITTIFVLIAVTVAVIATNVLYRPVDSFLRQVRQGGGDEQIASKHRRKQDEFLYVSNRYQQMVDKLDLVKRDSEEKETIVKSYYIRKLLLNSVSITAEELTHFFGQRPIADTGDQARYAVCVMKIDRLHDFDTNTSPSDKRLYYFAISNIANELLSSVFRSETVDMRRDHMAAILSVPKQKQAGFLEEAQRIFKRIQEVTGTYYKLSLTVAISEPFDDIRETTDYYARALSYSMYRMKYGHQSIITPEMAAEEAGALDFYIPEELERKLISGLKSNDPAVLRHFLDQYVELGKALSYDQFMQSIYQVIMTTRKTLKEINAYKLQPITIDMNQVHQNLLEQETIDEVRAVLAALFEDLTSEVKSIPSLDKNDVLLETIKELVALNYTDVNLSLQSIASMLHMSVSYVGRSFKKSEGISVAEYINEVRLSQAEKLLSNKDYSVIEIMERVGFINQSQFFKLFKKKFGATPREYRLKKLIE
ncbi:helix-turn-helix domain-containing protein [Paenibacillus sp.]|uniref:helix-turn-helix domain-containing protein n=1 Tax=Paenibacillus sp. TaxID=58172 RepID=UPI002D2755F8|nr:helix-turn-helix domain-containing protein [Paenibacillus sp.]HZG56691.1 helix-turn-helix domain-containing protein [Paenibacillus sp.]